MENLANRMVRYVIPVSMFAGSIALEEAIAPNYAFAQTRTDEVTAPVRVEELSDLVASATLNGFDTMLISWLPPKDAMSYYDITVTSTEGKQPYRIMPNQIAIKEENGKRYAQVLLGGVNGKNGETLSIEVKGNGAGVVVDGKAEMKRPIVLDVENAPILIENNNEFHKFNVNFPSPKPDKLWAYIEASNKDGYVVLRYGEFGGDNATLLDHPDYVIGGNYITRKRLSTEIIPEGLIDLLIIPREGAKVKSVTISPIDLLPYQMSSVLPQPTAVNPSTWGQIKSQYNK